MDFHVSDEQYRSEQIAVPASRYNYAELADIYNQTRVDYIVPMPMNARRMQQYVEDYDIDLDASVVALAVSDHEPNGLAMLGLRQNRAWITRLGVIPTRRRNRTGLFLCESLLDTARQFGAERVQLEVIQGNEPAYKLFKKLGFVDKRILLIIRRPPANVDPALVWEGALVEKIDTGYADYLRQSNADASWVTETASVLNAGSLAGLKVTLPDGENGWIIFQQMTFQLSQFVTNSNPSPVMMQNLLAAVHHAFALQDTKIENIPVDDPTWPVYQKLGYIEVFRRIEMLLEF